MKIAFFELEDWEKKYFEKKLDASFKKSFYDESLSVELARDIKDTEGLVIFIYSKITKEVLESLPNLKFITTMSTGFDHIDIGECTKRGIVVSNVPYYAEATVAEHTFALILAISRRIIESNERAKSGQFSPKGLTGFELRGKTLGVIGIGSIGQHVVRIAKGFEMNVLGLSRHPDLSLEKKLGLKFSDLDTLCSQSDIITLHIPHSKETHHFFNDETFKKVKKGVIIINTARGGLIDNTALLSALHSEKVRAAGLDVLEEEPLLQEEKALLSKEFNREQLLSLVENHMVSNHKNVIVTPHNAFNSIEALRKIIEVTHDNISSFSSSSPINVVKKS